MKKGINAVKAIMSSLLLLCLALGYHIPASAADDINFMLEPGNTTASVVVRFLNVSVSSTATIRVLDRTGDAIYEEVLQPRENYAKKYNFSELKPGRYIMVMESEAGSVEKPFIVNLDGSVREDRREAFRQFRPVVIERKSEEMLLVMFENKTGVPLMVELMDRQGNKLYTEKVFGYQQYGKSISLKDIPANQYTLNISCDDYQYHYEFKKFR